MLYLVLCKTFHMLHRTSTSSSCSYNLHRMNIFSDISVTKIKTLFSLQIKFKQLTKIVACSSSLGHNVDGELRGFLYILPSSSISVDSSSSSQSSSSSSYVWGAEVVASNGKLNTVTLELLIIIMYRRIM